MIICDAEQGTAQWHEDRAGVVSASKFSVARAKVGGLSKQQAEYAALLREGVDKKVAAEQAGYSNPPTAGWVDKAIKGQVVAKPSETAKKYAFRLAMERICGRSLSDEFQTWAMRRGNELEPDARAAHEFQRNVRVERIGFAKTDCGRYGASADGRIAAPPGHIGTEYKCLISPESIMPVMLEFDLSEYMDQMQGGMWVTGWSAWEYGLYIPDLAPEGKDLILHRVPRDDNYIESLEADLLEFDELVETYRDKIQSTPTRVGFDSEADSAPGAVRAFL